MVLMEFSRCPEQMGSAALRMISMYSQLMIAAWVTPVTLSARKVRCGDVGRTAGSNGAVDEVGIENFHVGGSSTGIRPLR